MLLISVLVLLFSVILLPFAYWYYQQYKFRSLKNIPGPKPIPFFGNVFPTDAVESFALLTKYTKEYGNLMKLWTGPYLRIFMSNPDHLEVILSSNEHITKSIAYDLVKPWLGQGLLVQTGQLWKQRRRMLTPSFHFKILEQFMDVFNESSNNLVKKLDSDVGKPVVDIYDKVTLHALDVICETSMGIKVHALQDSNNEYVKCVRGILEIFGERFFSPWKQFEYLFTNFAATGEFYKKALEITHNLSSSVIKSKLANSRKYSTESHDGDDIGIKKKLALIDTLVKPENGLTLKDIRAEIDTFMFEGHDTTASSISFCFYSLAQNPDVQKRVYEEIVSVVGKDDVELNINYLNDMKYLDMVIKESQRLYSTVPSFERMLEKEFEIGGIVYPKGTILTLFVYDMHLNEKIYPDSKKFDPLRFLPDNVAKRHKFAYVPFSAGARNCIGQKFAVYEMKTTIIKVLQHYQLFPVPGHQLKLGFTGVLKSSTGIQVRLQQRQK